MMNHRRKRNIESALLTLSFLTGCLQQNEFQLSSQLKKENSGLSTLPSTQSPVAPETPRAPVETPPQTTVPSQPKEPVTSNLNGGYQFPISTRTASKGVFSSVSTFESMSLYFKTPNGSVDKMALVRYRAVGESLWKQGHPLWFDDRPSDPNSLFRVPEEFSKQYRGSLVNLKADTEYEVEILLNPTGEYISSRVKTWAENKPILKSVEISANRSEPLVISESGTEKGYILYKAKSGEHPVIDVQRRSEYNVSVTGSYIIIRGLTLKNAIKHGIVIGSESRNIIIEDNDISGWGRIAEDEPSKLNGWGMNLDSAISTNGKANSKVTQLVIQRNKLHDPYSTSNNWEQPRQDYDEFEKPRFSNGAPVMNPHPIGPQGISLTSTSGNHVIRYNKIYSSDPVNGTKFNDGIGGGGSNFTTGGAPGRDSDIYGNEISDTWDDGIESEGGNINTRIWGNYIHDTYMSIAVSPVAVGPMYIFRNVAGFTRRNFGDKKGGNFIKGQSRIQMKKVRDPNDSTQSIQVPDFIAGGGRVYVYHNTTAGQLNVGISRSNEQLLNYVTRNNILQGKETAIQAQVPMKSSAGSWLSKFDPQQTGLFKNNFNSDLYFPSIILTESNDGVLSPVQVNNEVKKEENGIQGSPTYDNSLGSFTLKSGTSGHDAAELIPGFNDDYVGKAPDIGAQENGAKLLKFGN